jgi:hypothetical protein
MKVKKTKEDCRHYRLSFTILQPLVRQKEKEKRVAPPSFFVFLTGGVPPLPGDRWSGACMGVPNDLDEYSHASPCHAHIVGWLLEARTHTSSAYAVRYTVPAPICFYAVFIQS